MIIQEKNNILYYLFFLVNVKVINYMKESLINYLFKVRPKKGAFLTSNENPINTLSCANGMVETFLSFNHLMDYKISPPCGRAKTAFPTSQR